MENLDDRTRGIIFKCLGVICLCSPLWFAFITTDTDFVFIPVVLFVVGIFCMIAGGLNTEAAKEQEQRAIEDARRRQDEEDMRNFSDPKWRKEHPALARQIQERKECEERSRERAREIEREQLKRPAAKVTDIFCGHFYQTYYFSEWRSGPDSFGGWDIRCTITNSGIKPIKYVKIIFVPYNAVGDKCYDIHSGLSDKMCVFTGPFEPGGVTNRRWDGVWYQTNINRVEVESIHVDFMDGTSQDIDANGQTTNHGF